MSAIPYPPNLDFDDSIEVTDIAFSANTKSRSTIDFDSDYENKSPPLQLRKKAQLEVVDEVFGPFKIGSFSITRRALHALGATVNGVYLDGENTFFKNPKRSFINALQFSPVHIEARMRTTGTADDYNLPSLLFEMASHRPLTAPPLLRDVPGTEADPNKYQHKLDKLLKSAQMLDIHNIHMPANTPSWVNRVKSSSMIAMGSSLQAFGIYSGLRGLQDAINKKNDAEILFNSLSLGADVSSLALELALTRQAKSLIMAGQSAYKDFAKTSFGVRLGRGAGLIASALTLPFDIISAIKSLNDAAKTTGKEAMDHYFSAGLSVTSAVVTVVLGIAALAGFSLAGPVGLGAGLLLVAGSLIYGAVRVVDDIDDYIELSDNERWRTGWFALFGISPDDSVQDRYEIAKATVNHSHMLRTRARNLLDGKLRETTEVIVNGNFEAAMKPTQVRTYNWDAESFEYKTVNKPVINDGDDYVDARNGIPANLPGAEFGIEGESKGAVWFIGAGDDTILGIEKKSNTFIYGAGKKHLTGGEKDDKFIFEGAAHRLKEEPILAQVCALKGGQGSDTLTLAGNVTEPNQERFGYYVDLNSGKMQVRTQGYKKEVLTGPIHTTLDSIENVETLLGASSKIIGNDDSNIIKSRGRDIIHAGAGDDRIYLYHPGTTVAGDAGKDHYFVAHTVGTVFISEDGEDDSFIVLDWRYDLIENWEIRNHSLVITSTFDLTDEKQTVVIENTYKTTDNQRQLHNRKLHISTKDGFHLTPDCPETITTDTHLNITASITRQGNKKNLIILNSSSVNIDDNQNKSYFIPCTNKSTQFYVKNPNKNTLTTLYVDHTSDDLTFLATQYELDLERLPSRDQINYQSCCLTLGFGENSLSIHNLAASNHLYNHYINDKLAVRQLDLTRHFILIMKDKVSYRITPPRLPDRTLMDETFRISGTMSRNIQSRESLTQRARLYDFFQPVIKKAHILAAREACINLTPPMEQTEVEHLEGQGSTYLIHLTSDMTLRIATPGALANATTRLPYASTWEIDASQLGKAEIKLVNNHLLIGRAVIQLPTYENPEDLIDIVRVITFNGIIYVIDLNFDSLYIDSLDARYFKHDTDSITDLLQDLSTLNKDDILVKNITMKDGTPGALSFNLSTCRWILATEKLRDLQYEDLRLLNRCSHQLKDCVTSIRSDIDRMKTISAPILRARLDTCQTS